MPLTIDEYESVCMMLMTKVEPIPCRICDFYDNQGYCVKYAQHPPEEVTKTGCGHGQWIPF